VYFNEYNLRMGRMCYLPIVSGLLRAHAETNPRVKAAYEFMPFIYHLDSVDAILSKYVEPPDVAAFSMCMWNEQCNLHVAEEVRRRWPDCLIIAGGPQVPHEARGYLERYPFLDVCVRAEGEEPFSAILDRYLESDDISDIPDVMFRDRKTGSFHSNTLTRPYKKSLDDYPSPYLEGLYDDLLRQQGPELEFQAIIETNRGCPFPCTFCYWGRGGLTRKYRFYDLDRVAAEIDWCGRNRIKYVFNADSNFGMHPRDMEIAQHIVATKKKYGFPEKFRTCYGKNTDDKIFEIGALFHANQLEKGITLARQSNDEQTLENIRRQNIKMSTYQNLQRRFNDLNVPIYSEMILGLPGETEESWKNGIDELLMAGLKNQLFVYMCQVYPNTEMADPEYQKKFGIRTHRLKLNEIHTGVRDAAWVSEYEEIITSTNSMPEDAWRRMAKFSWMTMVMHSMKLGYYLLTYLLDRYDVRPSAFLCHIADRHFPADCGSILAAELAHYDELLTNYLRRGEGRGEILPKYGPIYWDVEEATFLRVSDRMDDFYEELHRVVRHYLAELGGAAPDERELADVIAYQRARMPTPRPILPGRISFASNVAEYFDMRFGTQRVPLAPVPQDMEISPTDYGDDYERFARETILWGRKSGTMLVPVAFDRTSVEATLYVEPVEAVRGATKSDANLPIIS